MAFSQFLLKLTEVLHFISLEPDDAGACLIKLKQGESAILFEFDDQLPPHTILLSAPLAEIPNQIIPSIYESLLIANSMLDETLSLRPDSALLYLHRRLHPDISSADLTAAVHSFATTEKQWKERITAYVQQRAPLAPKKIPTIPIFPYKA